MRLRHLVISSLVAASFAAVAAEAPGAASVGQVEANLTIETSDKPLETVLQWISRRAGVNVVCNEAEQPRITLRLVNVTWQEAVQQIAAKYDLVVEKRSDRVWVLTRPPKVRMEFQEARLGVVLEALARQANVNIVFSDIDASKRVTMTLNGVPWKHALDVIVRDVGYAWVEREYNIIQVVTPDKLQKDLVTRIFPLNYTPAETLKDIASQNLGSDGKVVVESRTNSLILTGTLPAIEGAERILTRLDQRTRQVHVSMKFVEFSDSDVRKIGFDSIGAEFSLANAGVVGSTFRPFAAVPTATVGMASYSAPYAAANSSSTNTLTPRSSSNGNFSGTFSFEAISFLNSTEVLQEPSLLMLDNQQAKIEIGRELRFAEETVTTEQTNTTRTLKEAATSPVKDGVTISVTPHITGDGYISIDLEASNELATLQTFTNKVDAEATDATTIQLPQKDITKVKTTIMVADGRTGVIGGILKNSNVEKQGEVPLLASIPVLGYLFKKNETTVERRNMTIFITPRIIHTDGKGEHAQRIQALRDRLTGVNAKPVSEAASPAAVAPAPARAGE